MKEAILKHIYKNADGQDTIRLRHYALDFSAEYLFFGFTGTGNLKLGDVYSHGPDGVKWLNKIGKVSQNENFIIIKTDESRFSLKIKIGEA